jgi:hypothetical protein
MRPQRPSHWEGLTVVATVSGMLTAQVLQAKLEEAGIKVLLDYESASVIFGITAEGLKLSQVRLLVADQDAEEAHRILESPPPPGWEEEATSSPDES